MQITVFLWKSGFLDVAASNKLAQALSRGTIVFNKIRLLEKGNFQVPTTTPSGYDFPP